MRAFRTAHIGGSVTVRRHGAARPARPRRGAPRRPRLRARRLPGLNGRLAFTSDRDAGGRDAGNIYSAWSEDGSDQRVLVDDRRDDAQAQWSPDGLRLAWRASRIVSYNIHHIARDGTDIREIATAREYNETQPSWSPDGTRLLYRSDADGDYDVWIMDADGANATRVLDLPDREVCPGFSSDGRRIVFRSNPGGNEDLFLLELETGAIRRLTDAPGYESGPAWSPDGTQIAFTTERDQGNSEIYAMGADGSAPRNVSRHPGKEESPDWQPIPHPPGAYATCAGGRSLKAQRMRCERALRLAAAYEAGDTSRLRTFTCTPTPHSFGQSLVDCLHRNERRRFVFVSRG